MTTDAEILAKGREVLQLEANAVGTLAERIGEGFIYAVRLLQTTKGRVIVTGMGKSGHIGRKIAATLSSTGTPAFFMHPGEAAHGDLGMVTPGDVVIALSNSGKTPEILALLPELEKLGARLIALVGNPDSPLAAAAEAVLYASVEREACPLNLAPTTSTTAALALGDAVAVALMELNSFQADDFARYHPGGKLGERLRSLKVKDLLISGHDFPSVPTSANFKTVVEELSNKRQGITAVVGETGELAGVISNGDILRVMTANSEYEKLTAAKLMSVNPRTARLSDTAEEAVAVMESHNITALVVIDEENRPLGLVHLHDALGRRQFWSKAD